MISFTPLSVKKFQTVNRFVRSATCEYLAAAGLDFIEVSGGMAQSGPGPVRNGIAAADPEGYFRTHARVDSLLE